MSAQSAKAHTETVTFGHVYGGKVFVTPRGAEAYGPRDEYVATFPALRDARKALFELHQASEAGQVEA